MYKVIYVTKFMVNLCNTQLKVNVPNSSPHSQVPTTDVELCHQPAVVVNAQVKMQKNATC